MKKYLYLAALLFAVHVQAEDTLPATDMRVYKTKEQAGAYSLSLPNSWKPITENMKEYVLWYPKNCNYTVWAEDPVIHVWADTGTPGQQIVCNVFVLKKTAGLGANFYNEIGPFFYQRFFYFTPLEFGSLSIANVKAKWQTAQFFDQSKALQHYYICFSKGLYVYEIYFWGTPELMEKRFGELKNIATSFTLLN